MNQLIKATFFSFLMLFVWENSARAQPGGAQECARKANNTGDYQASICVKGKTLLSCWYDGRGNLMTSSKKCVLGCRNAMCLENKVPGTYDPSTKTCTTSDGGGDIALYNTRCHTSIPNRGLQCTRGGVVKFLDKNCRGNK